METGYNGRGHVWASYYGTVCVCLMGKVEAKAQCDRRSRTGRTGFVGE